MADKNGGANGDADGGSGTGMELPMLKRMLALSRRTKINVALGQGDAKSGGLGLILMDKVMPGKQMVKELKEQFPGARSLCFGTASIDMDTDPKQVNFAMNKRFPGLDRCLKKSLKGTGYSKVAIKKAET